MEKQKNFCSELEESNNKNFSNKCSCYDSDCDKVEDKTACYIGINQYGVCIGVADGYCPYIHNQN